MASSDDRQRVKREQDALRQHEKREREKRGLIVLPIEVPLNDWAERAIAAGRISERDSNDKKKLAEVFVSIVEQALPPVTRDYSFGIGRVRIRR